MRDTVGRLREAAEELLLERGQAATTLRDITDRAGANVASVSYHFGSKDALLAEVFRSVLEEATAIQQARMEALPTDAPLDDLVRVWLAPALPSPHRDPREARLWSIIQKGMTEQAPGLVGQAAAIQPVVEQHLIERLGACLPQLSREELLVRHAATLAAIAALGGGAFDFLLPRSGRDDESAEQLARLLVAWVVGGLQAAPAGRPSG